MESKGDLGSTERREKKKISESEDFFFLFRSVNKKKIFKTNIILYI